MKPWNTIVWTTLHASSLPAAPHLCSAQNGSEDTIYRGLWDEFSTESMSLAITHMVIQGRVEFTPTGLALIRIRCVNALSWARDGELLLSGGDDTTVRVWRIDATDTSQEYPFVCRSVIQTGHRANIFSVHMLPRSSRMCVSLCSRILIAFLVTYTSRATVAGDKQVRVFDVGEAHGAAPDGQETVYSSRQSCTHILRCHEDRVKRVVTEHSPDLFLSVAEVCGVNGSWCCRPSPLSKDGSVRQHDLRTSHNCRNNGSCPAPLVKVNHELSTLALSPLTPYQFVVAGESPYVCCSCNELRVPHL
jgi:WD repeat-containing protein 42A